MLIRLSLFSGSLGVYGRGAPLYKAGSALSPAAFGMLNNNREWKVALDAYNEDKLEAAYRSGVADGVGSGAEYAEALEIIDAEYRTGQKSEITRVGEWLEVEADPNQHSLGIDEIGRTALTAVTSIFRTIGLQTGLPILVTILESKALLPPQLATTGYVTMKDPYAKYCLPFDSLASPDALRTRIECLAACHAAGVLSAESAATWLIAASEALSSVGVETMVRARFCAGDLPWLKPHELNLRLIGVKLGDDEEAGAGAALAQAILIGRYLLGIEKPAVFRKCLTYHMPTSVPQHIRLLMSNDPTRDACKHTFGYAPEYLFEQALAACCK